MDKRLCGSICLLWITYLSTGIAQTVPTPTLTVGSSTGSAVSSEDYVRASTAVTFTCTYDTLSPEPFTGPNPNTIYFVDFQREVDGNWNLEGTCSITNPTIEGKISDTTSMEIAESNIACSTSSAVFTGVVHLSKDVNFRCSVRDTLVSNSNQFSDTFVVNAYSKPTTPIIKMDPTRLVEGQSVKFTCTSMANPQPELRFVLDGVAAPMSNRTPAASADDLLKQGSQVWDTVMSKDNNGKELKCEIVNHLYTEEEVSKTQTLDVYYGPDPNTDMTANVSFSLDDGTPELVCEMTNSNPTPEYSWYSGNTYISSGATFAITSEYYDSLPRTLTFICRGTNQETTMTAEKTFTVNLSDGESTSGSPVTPDKGENADTTPKPGPEGWVIGVAVGVSLAVLIIICVIVCCCIRRKNRDKEPEKAKAARRSSDDRNDNSKYQSSTGSLSRPDLARGGSYHDNPTLPVDYRYSQHSVEQYAEVIDDMPRSRKPIALEDMEMFDDNNVPSVYNEAPPPAYTTDPSYTDMGQYGTARSIPNYSTYSPSYGSSYGAAC